MKPFAWSFVVTGMAGVLFAVRPDGFSDASLRGLGAVGGAALALAGAAWGASRCRYPRQQVTEDATRVAAPRFFLDRRRVPRHEVALPVQLAVNGSTYPATLLSVGARGALLRLESAPGQALETQVGQPVRIEGYPAGMLSRIGDSGGVYVDFAVQFEAPKPVTTPEPELVETAAVRSRRV